MKPDNIIPKVADEFNDVKKKSTGFINEFKKFAIRGNVIDLAIGVIIGAAFNNIVQSLVKDVITPPLGLITGKLDFTNMYINLSSVNYSNLADAEEAGAPIIRYGLFLNNLLQFFITAFVIFIIVRQINKFTEKKESQKTTDSPTTKKCPYCYSEINIKATRCPECTSELTLDKKVNVKA